MPDILIDVPLNLFLPPKFDREHRDGEFLDRLGASLLKSGFMHPIRCLREVIDDLEHYRVLTGWSRVLGGRRVGLATAPTLVLDHELTEAETLIEQIVENDLRSDTNPLDKARFFLRLQEVTGWSQAEVATATHSSPAEVSKILQVSSRLPDDLKALVGIGPDKICPRAAWNLSRLSDHAEMRELAGKLVKGLLKVESLEAEVARRIGKRKGRGKPVKAKTAKGVAAIIPALDYETVLSELGALAEAVRRAQKLNLPLSAVPNLLKAS